jgi:6-methylsalicylate decarboxylase
MDAAGTSTAILSLSSPEGVWFDAQPTNIPQIARACNDFAAEMLRAHPQRFGLFACLPMPDVEASLKEIAYAFDVLHADGITMPTSFGDVWPGNPRFAQLFAELNRRKAIVFFHPYAPNCCGIDSLHDDLGEWTLEYPYDTGRCVLSLLFGGTLLANRDIRFIFCHGGGPIPVLAGRIERLGPLQQKNYAVVTPNGLDFELRRLYYDTANAAYSPTMAALMKLVPTSQILFGTDYPYVTSMDNAESLASLELAPADFAAIRRGNAERLIPRLSALDAVRD